MVLGYPAHFAMHRRDADPTPTFIDFDELMAQSAEPGLFFAHAGPESMDEPTELGRPTAAGGRAAAQCIELAIDACLKGRADAICTAPISKEGLRAAGYDFPGHTEMLAERSSAPLVAMMLAGGGLRVVLATIHEALDDVPKLIDHDKLAALLRLVRRSMPDFGIAQPRIGVAGLNPHSGEGGLFGREESEIIEPAIATVRDEGIDAIGPLAADTLFHRMLQGEFDVIVAMYHDQGLIPVKTLDFHGGVNITLGLPFVRTSPDHGTAYALAVRGEAQTGSILAALDQALLLARGRRR